MKKIRFRDLTLNNIHAWPFLIKNGIIALMCIFSLIIGWLFDTKHLFNQLSIERNQGIALQKEFLIKQKKAMEIKFHQEKLQTLKKKFSLISPPEPRHKEPLELFPIASLRLIGILKKENTRWALITTPYQTVYQITKGSYIGENNGRVIAITDNTIDILELIPGSEGLEEKRTSLTFSETTSSD